MTELKVAIDHARRANGEARQAAWIDPAVLTEQKVATNQRRER
jgi:hypothetical protein